MQLELTEEEATVLHQILGDYQLHALDQLSKSTDYQFHDEVRKWRKRFKVSDTLYKRLTKVARV